MCAKKTNSNQLYKALKDEIEKGSVNPVYYICGEEDFYPDLLIDTFTDIIPDEQRDFNFDLLYGQDIGVETVLSIAKSFPMMAERRLLIVKNFLQCAKTGEAVLNDLIPYIENPNPSTTLVMVDAKSPRKNTLFGKALTKTKHARLVEFDTLPDYLIPDWVIDWAKLTYKKQIDPSAAQLLSQFVGNNLQLLSTEIDKVCTFVDTSDTITQTHVKEVIGSYRDYTAIELKEALLKRDLNRSLYIAEQILQHTKSNAGEIIRLVGFFYSVFINIWQIKRLSEKGNAKHEIQSKLGIRSNWYFDKLWQDASHFQYGDMPRIFEALLDADRSAKGFSTLDPTSILFLFIRRVIG